MRSDEGTNLTRLTRDKLAREKLLLERMFVVALFVWVITANLSLVLLRTSLDALRGWAGVFLGVATVVALGAQAWVLYSLRQQVLRRQTLIAGMNEMLQPSRVKLAEAAPREDQLSPQVRQVFDALGPDTTKH